LHYLDKLQNLSYIYWVIISIVFYVLEIILIGILTVFLHKNIDKDNIEEEYRNNSSSSVDKNKVFDLKNKFEMTNRSPL
jgi:hypothetical protein